MSALLGAVRALRSATEAQLAAALTLRGADVAALHAERTDALFAVRVALAEEAEEKTSELLDEVRSLAVAERRLAAAARTIVSVLDGIGIGSPAVYGPGGRVGG